MSRKLPCPKQCGATCDSEAAQCHTCRDHERATQRAARQAARQAAKAQTVAASHVSPPLAVVASDRTIARQKAELTDLKVAYTASLAIIDRLERENDIHALLQAGVETFTIPQHRGAGESEGTIIVVASDWHMEERVGPEVGGLNTYTLDIAHERITRFFQSTARLTHLLRQDITIPTIVLALLGDFISGDIHEENVELAEIAPTHAIIAAQNAIISGLEFLLANVPCHFVVPCHSGNHARTTKTTHFSAENGHSLEYLMYLHVQTYFRNEPRITFIVPPSYHSYLDVYGTRIRFHHGHAIKYGGGVGGLTIPANKAIGMWNRARRADLDVFGHFHTRFDGGNFIANGSLIGYNGFAVAIKAAFEKPAQQLLLMDKKRGRTCVWPLLVTD